MVIGWTTVLNKLNKLPGFSARAEHVALSKDLYTQAQEEAEHLRERCETLEKENAKLKVTLGALAATAELVEVDGILWKTRFDGGFDSKPRCPNCPENPVMSVFPPHARIHWVCSKCNGVFDYVDPPKD